jgi:glycosyltransferase involved in cell wall biosynthesis
VNSENVPRSTSRLEPWRAFIFAGLCWLGLLAPSSSNGVLSSRLPALGLLCMVALTISLILISGRLSSRLGLLLGVVTGVTPWLISWARVDRNILPGIGLQFFLLGLAFCLPLTVVPSRWVRRVVLPVVELYLAICAIGVMSGVPAIGHLLADAFGQYYETLVPNMVALHRPVGPFATHSVAAFAYYLLMFTHLRSFQRRESLLDLSLACFWLVVIGALSSGTAAAMLVLGTVDLMWSVIRAQRASIRRLGVALAVVCVGVLLYSAWFQRMLFFDLVSRVIGNQSSSLLGRYNPDTGTASRSIIYLRLHPFAPIGLADIAGSSGPLTGQTLGDSGPVNYLLRGGLVLLGSVYGGLWVLLRGTIGNRRVAVWLWGVTVAFELGFSALLVPRIVALTVLTAVCLRDIYAADGQASFAGSSAPNRVWRREELATPNHMGDTVRADAGSSQRPPECGAVPVVRIMMSTFNGARFLPELLKSVARQTGVTVRWWIRDDGSTDSTREILADASKHMNLHVLTGPNKGVVFSYLELVQTCPQDADLYAFCDQDDVWLPAKLERAAQKISACGTGAPMLYCSRLIVVDSLLRELGLTLMPRRPLGLQNALVQNAATGCTIVMNETALALLQQATPDPKRVVMHDHWAYLVVSALGTVVFDPTPSILYRQHDSNVVGARSGLQASFRRVRRAFDSQRRLALTVQDVELERLYGQAMDNVRTTLVRRCLTGVCAASFRERLLYALTGAVYRQRCIDDIVMKVLISLGAYRVPQRFQSALWGQPRR